MSISIPADKSTIGHPPQSRRRQVSLHTVLLTILLLGFVLSWIVFVREQSRNQIHFVKGIITVDGKPLPGGTIIFFSTSDDQLVGSKIKDGKFKVDRVAVGSYRVSLVSEGIPSKYSSEYTSGLTFEMRPGSNELDLDLRSK